MTEQQASGGDNDYWLLPITHPKRLDPYTVKCEDIIKAMEMPFAEATVFKSLWRLMQLRRGRGKPGSTETSRGREDGLLLGSNAR